MNNTELTHWGVRGMRWGVRRYQRKDGSLTPAGKKRYSDGENSEVDKEAYEESKQKAIKSGSAQDVLKFKGDLTPQEMQTAINRIRWEQDMQSLSEKEIAAGKNHVESTFGKIDKATGYINTAAKAWNTVANIYNAFNKRGAILPKIDTNIANGNKAARDLAKKRAKEEADEEAKKRTEQATDTKQNNDPANKKSKKAEKVKAKVVDDPRSQDTDNKSKSSTVIDAEWRDVSDQLYLTDGRRKKKKDED